MACGRVRVVRSPPEAAQVVFNPLGLHERNELFVGRLAMVGLVASLMGERITGKGPLAQLGIETGLPTTELEPLLVLLVVVGATTAAVPFSDRFIGAEAPAALGLRYTANRQRLLGRLSMLAFVSGLVLEAFTGSGPLDLLELDTGVPMDEVSAMFVFLLLLIGIGDMSLDEDSQDASAAMVVASAEGQAFANDADDDIDWNADDGDDEDE